jgi:hypothetical protein
MKNESVSALLEAGEIVKSDDVIYMLDVITGMIERGMDTDSSSFIGLAMQLMSDWRESLEDASTPEADAAIQNIVMGISEGGQ